MLAMRSSQLEWAAKVSSRRFLLGTVQVRSDQDSYSSTICISISRITIKTKWASSSSLHLV